MATGVFGSLFRRRAPVLDYPPKFRYDVRTNPYQCKRPWPPNFEQLSPKHQFRLERRYRRRTKLKWARPVWKKWVTLAQWGSILGVLVYGVLYLDVHDELGNTTVFDSIRRWWGDATSLPRNEKPTNMDPDQAQAQKG
jgi:hypothetical protein